MLKHIYFDNNATTAMDKDAAKYMTEWLTACSNPSGSTFLSVAGQKAIEKTSQVVKDICKLTDHIILYTSGASESNCTILCMVVDAWYRKTERRPHIVATTVEHKATLICLEKLRTDYTLVPVDMNGCADLDTFREAIKKPNTILSTVMYANNETGAINNIKNFAQISHEAGVPFHTDAVQMFGKIPINMDANEIDAMSMSFHKLYGPQGLGMLILNRKFVEGFQLKCVICGTQQSGLRGGTENTPAIVGAGVALRKNFYERGTKNKKLLSLKERLLHLLNTKYRVINYKNYPATPSGQFICVFGQNTIPNTLLLSFVDTTREFCNVKFKKYLEANKIIISIGSACNTNSANASHVVMAMNVPPEVRRGIMRISFGDSNTPDEIETFFKVFEKGVKVCYL